MIGSVIPLDMDQLAPMPVSVAKLATIVGDPNASAADVAKVIALDQALTANVLRLANSAWSGSATQIVTAKDAVLRLGAARILELAVGQRVSRQMNQACAGYELAEHELWRHSVAAAMAVENLGKFTSVPIPGCAFTAALIHDIGKLLLNRHLDAGTIEQVANAIKNEKITYLEAERRVLGTDHAEVGGAVARHWKFPEPLVHAIARHHDPDAEPNSILDAVHIGNAVAKLNGVGLGIEQMNMNASTEAARRLGLSSSGLESLCATVMADLAKTEQMWGNTDHGD